MDGTYIPCEPQYGNMLINDHDLNRLPQIPDDVKLFPKAQLDLFELPDGSHELSLVNHTSFTVVPLQNPGITNDFPCTGFSSIQSTDAMDAMREAYFRTAAMRSVEIDVESLRPTPERKNVKISKDPQSVAARQRREKISHRMRILQRMVPGGMKLDTASMLDEAANYVKFLKKEIELLEQVPAGNYRPIMGDGFFPPN